MSKKTPNKKESKRTKPDDESFIEYIDIELCLKSRIILNLMRLTYKTILGFILRAKHGKIAWIQLKISAMPVPEIDDMPIQYDIVGKSPGHVFGKLDDISRPVILWIHGGAFILPASPTVHHPMVGKLCQRVNANGFMPDYRLAPFNPFPAGLNDCEQAYRELLNMGYSPSQIVLGGDSAGGNFVFGLLQRIRKSKLPMPACAIAVSPVTELGRMHGPPSRPENKRIDSLLPASALANVWQIYGGDRDSADPEISPLYMDCHHLPPLFIVAGAHEILRDDALMLAKRCNAAGIPTKCQIWTTLPHAFPLFSHVFCESEKSCEEIISFARLHAAVQEKPKQPQAIL